MLNKEELTENRLKIIHAIRERVYQHNVGCIFAAKFEGKELTWTYLDDRKETKHEW